MATCDTLEEVRRIKEECSLHYLSLTPEERIKEAQEAREWYAMRLGRAIPIVDHSTPREAPIEEVAHV